jgi:hypothetical protein
LQCRVGKSPWQDLSTPEWNQLAKDFYDIWKKRPTFDNKGGGGWFHYFGLFVTIRMIRPTAIVESGAWHGVGTWFLRQMAGPDVKIVVVSPNHPRTYVDKDGLYLTESKFVDFGKTTAAQWQEYVPDVQRTLLFIDDHQAGVLRLAHARDLGFKHMFFDDNYPPGNGDNFALKQVCAGMSLWNYLGETTPIFKDNFGKIQKELSPVEYQQYEQSFHDIVKVYAEFPPLWKGPTRFPNLNETSFAHIAQDPLFTPDQLRALGVEDSSLPGWDAESLKYTFAPYVEIK